MPDTPQQRRAPFYWERNNDGSGNWSRKDWPPGADLAALRRGIGREPGTVPALWPFYTNLNESGQLTRALRAEHTALTLFAVHQQSQGKPMHVAGIGLGRAIRALHSGERAKFSEDAVNRRFSAAATATSMAELALHLRGLISMLNDIPQAVDYSRLFEDLVAWQDIRRISQVRRRWGGQYFVWKSEPAAATTLPEPRLPDHALDDIRELT